MELPDYTELAYYDPVTEAFVPGPGLELDPDLHSPYDPTPEHVDYRDEGCEVAPKCLACPLPRCRHDDPRGQRREAKEKRNRDLLAVRRDEGLGVQALAKRFGLSRSMVHRILKEAKSLYSVRPDPVKGRARRTKRH